MESHAQLVIGTMICCDVDVAACTAASEATASVVELLCHLLHGKSSFSKDAITRAALVDAVVGVHLLEPGHRRRLFDTMFFFARSCEVNVTACTAVLEATASSGLVGLSGSCPL